MIRKLTIEVHSNGFVFKREGEGYYDKTAVFEEAHRPELMKLLDELIVVPPQWEVLPCWDDPPHP